MKRLFSTGPVVSIAAIAALAIGVAALIWTMSGLRPPREEDRVIPINGYFSIIKPRDWEATISYEPPSSPFVNTIEISLPHAIGRTDRMFVARTREKQNIDKLKAGGAVDGQFQGVPALFHTQQRKKDFVWQVFFEQNGQWYKISLILPKAQDVPKGEWWPFVESFRSQPVPPSSTAPSSAPTPLL